MKRVVDQVVPKVVSNDSAHSGIAAAALAGDSDLHPALPSRPDTVLFNVAKLFTYVLKNTPDDVKRWEIGLADGGGTRYFRSDDDGIVMWLDGFAHGRGSALTSIL